MAVGGAVCSLSLSPSLLPHLRSPAIFPWPFALSPLSSALYLAPFPARRAQQWLWATDGDTST